MYVCVYIYIYIHIYTGCAIIYYIILTLAIYNLLFYTTLDYAEHPRDPAPAPVEIQ